MKKNYATGFKGVLMTILIIAPVICSGQSEKIFINRYLKALPEIPDKKNSTLQKYRMTAVYTNMDVYGNPTDKTKVTGDYTRGLEDGNVTWNNVYIAAAKNLAEPFGEGKKQEYMENIKYVPSPKMMEESAFQNFPKSTENVFARGLIWDMMAFEIFAWRYYDSLKLNNPYIIPDITGKFNMADIGKYFHNKILLCWKGISQVNNELCAIIDFTAIDNKVELTMDQIKTKGTEQYWGTVLVALKTKNIEHAVMYSGTIQEIEVKGLKDKFLIKTIRELEVNKIQ